MPSISAALLLCMCAAAEPADEFQQVAVFTVGDNAKYKNYRVPGIVMTPRGTLLAYCEGRADTGSDWGKIDLVLRRSVDGGKTWSPTKVIGTIDGPIEPNPVSLAQGLSKPEDVTYNNATAIIDRQADGNYTVHMVYCIEYCRCFIMHSNDDGATFSKPQEITSTFEAFRDDYDWKVLATGPGHGIQLQQGKSGRLIVPVWLSTGTGGHAHRPSAVSVIYSDDHGQSWQAGDLVVKDPELRNPSETVAAQCRDGRVMLNIRHESDSHRRAVSFSNDGATEWTKPVVVPELKEPICMGGLLRYRYGDHDVLLFSNPDNLSRADGKEVAGRSRDRRNVTVQVSRDDGATWSVMRVLEPGPSAYSDLTYSESDGTIYCIYERGRRQRDYLPAAITVAAFPLTQTAEQ